MKKSYILCAHERTFMKKLRNIQLIEQARSRDPDAFTQLIRMYMQDMYKVAIAILKHDENAADAIQDTILVCWEKLDTLKKPEYFRTWLIRILINKCYDIRKEYASLTDLEKIEEPSREDQYNLEFKEAISFLGDKYSTVCVLYYWMGYNSREIADILGITPGTVRMRLKRARQKLKEYYEESHER